LKGKIRIEMPSSRRREQESSQFCEEEAYVVVMNNGVNQRGSRWDTKLPLKRISHELRFPFPKAGHKLHQV